MELRALIVDDEYPAREEVRYLLEKYDNIHIVGEAASVSEALTLIKSLEYDIVFLDINFPVKNGIDLGMEINSLRTSPIIIYITAYEQYAVKAFDVNAIDYILKPIDPDKFDRAIRRVFDIHAKKSGQSGKHQTSPDDSESDEASQGGEYSDKKQTPTNSIIKISAEQKGKIHLVDLDDIYYAYSEDSYIFIKKYENVLITHYTLSALEEKLRGANFLKVHRRCLVNLNKIDEISPSFKGAYYLIMSDKENSHIPVSRRQTQELRKIFDF